MSYKEVILVTGAGGQLGTELVASLCKIYKNVIATDLKLPLVANPVVPYHQLDVLDKKELQRIIAENGVTQIYHLVAILSANGEQNPDMAWNVNVQGLKNVLDVSVEFGVSKVFFPSTIAVFGPTTPKLNTPQFTIMEPTTVYGISKLAGERWCDWYFHNHNLDVRSIRYPGLISYKTQAGGGTTDYAVDIFFEALRERKYECFLSSDTVLPMMYMPDAIRGTIELMEASKDKIGLRSGYNFAGFSFSPDDIAKEIQKYIPNFEIMYKPDFRQGIADGWPQTIDDSVAKNQWGWKPEFDLASMTRDMLLNVSRKLEAIH